jgi:PBP1b-binding outer membrane lipoprotein LpoB
MKNLIVVLLLGMFLTSCIVSSATQEQVIDATITPEFYTHPLPTPTYFIPEKTPREDVIATLPKSKLINYSEKEIAHLLLEELLKQMKVKEDSDTHKIKDYEITDFSPRNNGYFDASYIITPSSDNFFMVNQQKLDDGRLKICYLFSVAKDLKLYYLSGYFGG